MTPTARTLRYLRERGHVAEVVERWNHHARIRQDLFGFIDVLSVCDGRVFGWQACGGSDVSARVAKVEASPLLPAVAAAMAVAVIGWKRYAKSVDGVYWRPHIVSVRRDSDE